MFGTSGVPLLWYQGSTAFVATFNASCPSYDAITGKQPASRRVSRSPSIDLHIVIDNVHPDRAFGDCKVTRLVGSGSGFTSAKGLGFLARSTRD